MTQTITFAHQRFVLVADEKPTGPMPRHKQYRIESLASLAVAMNAEAHCGAALKEEGGQTT